MCRANGESENTGLLNSTGLGFRVCRANGQNMNWAF